LNIGFLSNQIGLRGTEVAMFDYAKYNEELLGNKSIIATFGNELNPLAVEKFKNKFGKVNVIPNSVLGLNKFVEDNKIDILYKTCFGNPETIPDNCKVVIHAVFHSFSPFGNVYSYISEQIRNKSVPQQLWDKFDYVPYIIDLPNIDSDLRSELNIPKDAIVFGYHGGRDSFNIDFVKKCIIQNIDKNSNIYFLFMNIDKFYSHDRIIYLEGNSDMEYKTKFINSCNAMIHARIIGETFGASCGEFSLRNKPVITYKYVYDDNHLIVLSDKAIIYDNEDSLKDIILNFNNYVDSSTDYNCYRKFNPDNVMQKFKKVYID
jgi:hypothetical protein